MPEQNSKSSSPEKVNKLRKKFLEVEGLAETLAHEDLLQSVTNTQQTPPPIQTASRIEEEIVLWKKQSNDFRTSSNVREQNAGTTRYTSDWEQFTQNIRFIAPSKADVVFSNIPKNTDGMGKLFQGVCRILKNYPDFFSLSITQKYRGSAEAVNASGRCSLLFGLDVEALKPNQTLDEMRHNQESKLKVLRFLYQIKCREETDEIKVQLQHNKSTLEASEFIVIVFVYSPVVEKKAEPDKTTKSKIRQKSNIPLEM